MKAYFKQLFEHEHWANLKVLETLILTKEPPQRAIEIFSHTIAAQRIWLDRIMGNKTELKVWEVFDTKIMLELLEINYSDLNKLLDNQDINQLINYQNSQGEPFTNTINQILTHLALHASYHRGQVVLLLKNQVDSLPTTDYIFYIR
ncbi:DinB family protein [Emticicia sp. SJ17W-69]|uniref:DinB family protein n=1 Tax=Emticicia sp. SJ17W-69 TaxID=3421657 RepID=UPI003EBA5431